MRNVRELTYREQSIKVWGKDDVTYYLFNPDGDMNEYFVDSIEQAMDKIDKFIENNEGYFNSEGELVLV